LPTIGSYRLVARVEMPSAPLLGGALHSASNTHYQQVLKIFRGEPLREVECRLGDQLGD
jgi:hypothetical protein